MKRTPFALLVHLIPDFLKTTIKIPDVQREPKIWTIEQKQNLIDSIYNDFDIPKIYFREKSGEPNVWWLIDGQQRVTTIAEFLNNEFELGGASTIPQKIREKKYYDLPTIDKGKITGKALDCVRVECDDDEEEDMFTRLNNGTPLSAAEKRNAIQGEIRNSIKKLSENNFLKHKVNFSSRRFAHDAICAQLTLLCLSGGPMDAKGKSLTKLYEEKRIYPEREKIEKKIKKILSLMNKIFPTKEPYMKKYNVVSVFLFLNELSENFAVSGITNKQWYSFFDNFEKKRLLNSQTSEDNTKFDDDMSRYQMACVNSPDNEQGIKTRHDILLKKFFLQFPNIEPKDEKRDFCEHQKMVIYLLGNKKCSGVKGFDCPNKNETLSFEECEFDHKKEFNEAGRTIIPNGQILCKDCHNYKTQKYREQLKNNKQN